MSNVILTLSKCAQILVAYEDCVSKRPSDHEVVCRHLQAFAGWCALHEICPQEVEQLEACSRGSLANVEQYKHKSGFKQAMEAIDTCIQAHHDRAEQHHRQQSQHSSGT